MLVLSIGEFFNYAINVGLSAMICILRFIKIDLGIQKLMGWMKHV
jgi:hypothetical protein